MVLEKARDQPPARLTGAQSSNAGSCADSRRRTKRGGSDPLKWETGRNEAPVSGERVLGNLRNEHSLLHKTFQKAERREEQRKGGPRGVTPRARPRAAQCRGPGRPESPGVNAARNRHFDVAAFWKHPSVIE